MRRSVSSSLFISSPSPIIKRSINGAIGSAFTAAEPPAKTSGKSSFLSLLLNGIPAMSSISSTVVYAISYPMENASASNRSRLSPLSSA